MQCANCGQELAADARFCSKCGGGTAPVGEGPPAEKLKTSLSGAGDTDGEASLWNGGYSGKAMYGSWLSAGLFTIAAIVAAVFLPIAGIPVAILVPLVWIWLGCVLVYRKWSVDYQATTQQLVHKSGILKQVTDRIEMIDIDDVTYEQGIIQRMLGVGTIRITSSDRTHPELVLKGIDKVREVADLINNARRTERRKRGVHIESV